MFWGWRAGNSGIFFSFLNYQTSRWLFMVAIEFFLLLFDFFFGFLMRSSIFIRLWASLCYPWSRVTTFSFALRSSWNSRSRTLSVRFRFLPPVFLRLSMNLLDRKIPWLNLVDKSLEELSIFGLQILRYKKMQYFPLF